MKKIIILAVFIISSQSLIAQFQIGIVGSYSFANGRSESTLLGDKNGRKAMEVAFLDAKNSPSIGISLRKDFGYLYFDGQAHYRKSAYTMRIQNFQQIDAPMSYLEETTSLVHVPITGGLKFGKLRLGVGPIFNFQMNENTGDNDYGLIEKRERSMNMGFLGNVGYDITKNFSFSLRYEHAFSKVGDDYRYAGKRLPINSKLDNLTLSVGMHF